ncbi:MAG: 1-deoxy-D-xylulose-5-phosphate reductoisomerase [Synergistaceae bacterium]|nr:1-deoxy-D-xylulose-5-phosphate reductoisomerase [Synergistaceae bacterium]
MTTNPKRVAVVGATGSVGTAVLDVCRAHRDRLAVTALAAGRDAKKIALLAKDFSATLQMACLASPEAAKTLSELSCLPPSVRVLQGPEGLIELAVAPEIEHVVFASSGTAAIEALQAALKAGKEISLANKESVVLGGKWVMPLVRRADQLRPLDSEHNAIWQCLHGEAARPRKIYLTASGGPFRDWTAEEMKTVTPEMALKHPVWNMGAKITIDSATLMNKGIELIEAAFLFGLEPGQVDALISPGSFVHGMVEFEDGCVKMLAGEPNMRLPAASCLFWPERAIPEEGFPSPEPAGRVLRFDPVDEGRFPALALAKEALRRGGAFPALLVGADEVAVDRFLKKKIKFTDIAAVVEETMASYEDSAPESLAEAVGVLERARVKCAAICGGREIL